MSFLRNLLYSLLCSSALGWIISCFRWLVSDKGVVRASDGFYLLGAVAGILWFLYCLWHWLDPLHPKNWH